MSFVKKCTLYIFRKIYKVHFWRRRIKMKLVASHPLAQEAMDYLEENNVEVYIANSSEPQSYIDLLKTADAFIDRIGICDASIIEQCPNLKVIGRTGVGYDNVDVACATKHGIPVVITPGANTQSVAEHAVGLMFACAKNFQEEDQEIRKGNWLIRDAHKAIELKDKVVGIIGTGAIGSTVAALCKALGMKCIGYSHSHNREKVEKAGCIYYENLEDLLYVSDFLSIHIPLTKETRHFIGAHELQCMKNSAYLINTSRGAVVDEKALAAALNNGEIAGAGIDVFSTEPVVLDNPLFKAKNTILTPHAAALTKEALRKMCVDCAKGCVAVCRGEKWSKVVDCSVYEKKLDGF